MTNPNSHESAGSPAPDQREERQQRLIKVVIEIESGIGFSAIVTNISEHGMGGKTQGVLKMSEAVTVVKTGYGRVRGEVRWIQGDRFGVYFDDPIDVDLFNFSDSNEQGHFVPPVKNGHVWKGFKTDTSAKRPGFTSHIIKS